VDGLEAPVSVTIAPDGSHLYVIAGPDSVASFTRDSATGVLDLRQVVSDGVGDVEGLVHPAEISTSPDGKNVYVTGTDLTTDGQEHLFEDGSIVTFSRDITTGDLAFVQVLRDSDSMPGGYNLFYASNILFSPDGRQLYVTSGDSCSYCNSIGVFSRDLQTGELTFVQRLGGRDENGRINPIEGHFLFPSSVLSNDGSHLYGSAVMPSAVLMFDRDGETGELSFNQEFGTFEHDVVPWGMDISPDNTNLYVLDGSLLIYSRDADTGVLSVFDVLVLEEEGLGDQRGVRILRVSPLGDQVYIVDFGAWNDPLLPGLIGVFSRDQQTGDLNLIQVLRGGVDGIEGLDGASDIAISPDGDYVYVVAFQDRALTVFSHTP